jgi:type II secretory pathway pseudopilin PulG
MNQKIFKLTLLILIIIFIWLLISFSGQIDTYSIKSTKGAMHQMAVLVNAIENFAKDTGRYPTTLENFSALISKPRKSIRWKGPYLTQSELDSYFNGNQAIEDVWGTRYIYYSPAQYEKGALYELYSCGKNKRNDFGQKDDITNWQGVNSVYYADEQLFIMNDSVEKIGVFLVILIPILIGILVFFNKKSIKK